MSLHQNLVIKVRSLLSHLVNKRAIALAPNYSCPSKFDDHHEIACFSPCQQKSDRYCAIYLPEIL
ncbi:MAG: hypothetical protein V7K97_01360 [Nostoc sp.]|uniref:hypothetical protein n=1 Tax=Nostoc sp. TaxID=1180 RepID=UPI002FF6AC92